MAYDNDELRLNGVMAQGYGMLPKSVMQDQRLTIEAKAIYAYIASYAGAGTTAFPSKKKIAADLRISEERLYNHRKQLIKCGYITVTQERGAGGILGKTIYTLEAIAIERPDPPEVKPDEGTPSTENPSTDYPSTDEPSTENPSHNNNSSSKINNSKNNNSLNNNREKVPTPADVIELYNSICTSYPKVMKLSSSRKTAIVARLKEYTLDEIEKAFRMAEDSDFMKGVNDRGWKASFDWMMKDSNLVKVLEGNYVNNPTGRKEMVPKWAKKEPIPGGPGWTPSLGAEEIEMIRRQMEAPTEPIEAPVVEVDPALEERRRNLRKRLGIPEDED